MRQTMVAMVAALALALPAAALAQGKADFSGTWNFDEAKSDPAPAGRGGGGGGGGGRGGGMGTPSKLVIKQTAGELTVETTTANGAQTAVYKLDGSESVNKTAMGESKGKVSWEGNNLVINSTQDLNFQGNAIQITAKEVYSLAGNVLTVTTTRTTARGETTRKLVFNKG